MKIKSQNNSWYYLLLIALIITGILGTISFVLHFTSSCNSSKQPNDKEQYVDKKSEKSGDHKYLVITMTGCGWCNKLKTEVEGDSRFKLAERSSDEAKPHLSKCKGFPTIINIETGKVVSGFKPKDKLIEELERGMEKSEKSGDHKYLVITMTGCGWCNKLKTEVEGDSRFKLAERSSDEAKPHLSKCEGFPTTINIETGKVVSGFMTKDKLFEELEMK